jgi:hypothetical protein
VLIDFGAGDAFAGAASVGLAVAVAVAGTALVLALVASAGLAGEHPLAPHPAARELARRRNRERSIFIARE